MTGRRISRRRFLGTAGAAGAGLLVAGGIVATQLDDSAEATNAAVPFYGAHQAGIATPAQERAFVATFDLTTDKLDDVRALLRNWTRAAALMCAGEPVGPVEGDQWAPPIDTGEATGLAAANLTITVGVGPTFFERDGADRFGLANQRPEQLIDLPVFAGDALDPARCGGDIVVQACADDAQVTFHAVRNLARIARGKAVMRWSQLGFGRTASTSREQETPRNLFGFKDGTNNILAEDEAAMSEHVWAAAGDTPDWMAGGSYMVARRIRMLIEVWDRSTLLDQEQTFGRTKITGAPLGKEAEHDTVDLVATDDAGDPLIDPHAHIRLAASSENAGVRILRRGYSFTDGMDTRLGQLDAGLFFICFQRDPRTQFVVLQQRLSTDLLNEYIKHTGSGTYAIFPGVQDGGYLGETLLG
ncbi:MAG: iron uptake transporter deferrochelatase/peroxidase subunit [Thermomicrobiales bacterium]|nr:iron uptake transporter deferrochelatase/peroxidase subunit [Thermomicrobiales bacterium]